MYLLENFNCKDINERRTKEGEYIRKLKCINKRLECITTEERNEYIKEYKKITKKK